MKRKLRLNRETVRLLETSQLDGVQGAAIGSNLCSAYVTCHTCVTCNVSCGGTCAYTCFVC